MSALSRAPILIMAGGTGGHVFPALALARLLRARSHEVVWLGTQARSRSARRPGGKHRDRMAVDERPARQGRGDAAGRAVQAGCSRIWQALRRDAPPPAAARGRASAASSPARAAWPPGSRAGRCVIHEQNAIAGYSNRCLAHLARHVLAAFPKAFPPGVDARVVGNPVRAEILLQPPPAERFARREGALRLLIVGGSLGASRLNAVVPFAIARSRGLTLQVRHQAGERGIDAARERLRAKRRCRPTSRRSSTTWPRPTRKPIS